VIARPWLKARVWVPIFAIAAVLLAPPGTTLNSSYAAFWLAAGLALVAAIGRTQRWAAITATSLSTAAALVFAIGNLVVIARGGSAARWLLVMGALVVIALGVWRLTISRRTDPLLLVAVQLSVGIATEWVFFQVSGLALDYHSFARESLPTLAGTELSVVALAFAGVGLGVWRTWRPAIERLGWKAPTWWQVVLALLAAELLSLSAIPANILTYFLTPQAYYALGANSQHIFGDLPWWTFPFVAILAGVGEETLFRGAVQPRFGIVVSAALFAMLHANYGFTPILGMVFVHGLAYGLMRRHLNTTTAAIAHATYDFGAYVRIGYGTHFVLAVILALLLAAPAWRHRRQISGTLRQGFMEDWRGILDRPWRSRPSSTDLS